MIGGTGDFHESRHDRSRRVGAGQLVRA
jgi:hypothetical protein